MVLLGGGEMKTHSPANINVEIDRITNELGQRKRILDTNANSEINTLRDHLVDVIVEKMGVDREKVENEIKKLTIQKKETEELFNNANLNQDEIQEASKKLQKIISDIENKEDRWLELSMKLDDA